MILRGFGRLRVLSIQHRAVLSLTVGSAGLLHVLAVLSVSLCLYGPSSCLFPVVDLLGPGNCAQTVNMIATHLLH